MLLAIDTETTGVKWDDDVFMISVAMRLDPADGRITTQVWDYRDTDEDGLEGIEGLLMMATKIIMHHAKFDIQKLVRWGVPMHYFTNIDTWDDTQALAHLLDEHRKTGLKGLASDVLGESTDEDEVLKKYRRVAGLKKEDGYHKIPYEIIGPYAEKDAEFTLRLYEEFSKDFPESMLDLYNMEKSLTLALIEIENNGMRVDTEYVREKRREYGDLIYSLRKDISSIAGDDFNPNSPKQILDVLASRGVNVTATDKATLSAVEDDLARLIVEQREANKIKTTYFDAIWEENVDGILHPHFRQHGTRTGRMSSGAVEA